MEQLAEEVHADALEGVAGDETDKLHETLMTVKSNLQRLLNGHASHGNGARNGGS